MGIKIFLAIFLDLMILSNCLPLPGQIVKYKVPNKYFTNETSQSLNDREGPSNVSLLDLLTQVHHQGIPHPDVTKIQTADIQIEDVDAPIEEEILSESLDFNFKNDNTGDLKMDLVETTKDQKNKDLTEVVDNESPIKEEVKHVHVHIVKDESISPFDKLINKLVYDLSKSEDLLDAIKTNLDQTDNSNMITGSIDSVVSDNKKLTDSPILNVKKEDEKVESTTQISESTESVTNVEDDTSINAELTENNLIEENTELSYIENATDNIGSEEYTTEDNAEQNTENVQPEEDNTEQSTESSTQSTVNLPDENSEASTTKMDTEQDSTTVAPLNEESTQQINMEELPFTESIAKEIEKILLDVLREENADEELQLDSTRKTDESNDDFMAVVAQIHLKATSSSEEKEDKEISTDQPTNVLINQLNVETEHPSFDGETDEARDPNNVKPEFYEGEITEENVDRVTQNNYEIMEVQDDLIDVVKEMPDGTPIDGTKTNDDSTTDNMNSFSEEAKFTGKISEPEANSDGIIVMEIKDVVNDKNVDEASKLLQNVRNIIEMVEEQSLHNINNLKNVLRNPSSHNSHQSFLSMKDEILHSGLNTDLFP